MQGRIKQGSFVLNENWSKKSVVKVTVFKKKGINTIMIYYITY
jgi:hypothetical protein